MQNNEPDNKTSPKGDDSSTRCHESTSLSLEEAVAELSTCVHCSQRSSHVILLPCGHSLCSGCLENFKAGDQSSDSEVWIPCPRKCSYTIVIKQGQIHPSLQEIHGLNILDVISRTERSCEEHSMSDERSLPSSRNAQFICSDCNVSLCRSCAQQHCIPHPWEHRIQRLRDFRAQVAEQIFECPKHREKLSLFCKNRKCLEPICQVCFPVFHKSHHVVELSSSGSDMADAIRRRLRHTANQQEALDSVERRIDEKNVSCEEEQSAAINAVRAREQWLINRVQRDADSLVHDITNLRSGAILNAEEEKNAIICRRKKIQLLKGLLTSALSAEKKDAMSVYRFCRENEDPIGSEMCNTFRATPGISFVQNEHTARWNCVGKIVSENTEEGVTNDASGERGSNSVKQTSSSRHHPSEASGSEAPELPEFEAADGDSFDNTDDDVIDGTSSPVEDNFDQSDIFVLQQIHKVPLLVDYTEAPGQAACPCPSRVVMINHKSFVIRERRSNSIMEVASDGSIPSFYTVARVFRGNGKYFLEDPIDIAVFNDNILVLDRAPDRHCMVIFDRSGRGKQLMKFDKKPNALCCCGNELYVGFFGKICLYIIRPKENQPHLLKFSIERTFRFDGKWPWHIAANQKRDKIVVNLQGQELKQVIRVTPNDEERSSCSSASQEVSISTQKAVERKSYVDGAADEFPVEMRGLCFVGDLLLVADRPGSRILAVDAKNVVCNGSLALSDAIVVLSHEDGITKPVGIALGDDGEIVVGQENGEIRIYTRT